MIQTIKLLTDSLRDAVNNFIKHKDFLLIMVAIYAFCTAKAQEPGVEMLIQYARHIMDGGTFDMEEWNARTQGVYWEGASNVVTLLKYVMFFLSMALIYRFPNVMDIKSTFETLFDITKYNILSLAALFIVVWVLTFVGIVMLVVPGIYFALITAVAAPVLLLEDKGVMDSMKRSYELMKGHLMGMFLFCIGLMMVLSILYFIILLPAMWILFTKASFLGNFVITFFSTLLFVVTHMMTFEFYKRVATKFRVVK